MPAHWVPGRELHWCRSRFQIYQDGRAPGARRESGNAMIQAQTMDSGLVITLRAGPARWSYSSASGCGPIWWHSPRSWLLPSARSSQRVRVVAGEFEGVGGPVPEIAAQPIYLDIELEPGAGVELPITEGHL